MSPPKDVTAYKYIKGYSCGRISRTTAEDTPIGHIYSDPISLFGIIWPIVPHREITLLGAESHGPVSVGRDCILL